MAEANQASPPRVVKHKLGKPLNSGEKTVILNVFNTFCTNVIAISIGIVQAWSSPTLPILRSDSTILGEVLTDDQESWLGSIIFLSALIVSPVYSYINQRWGRKAAGYFTAIPLVIAWIIVIFADSITMLYIGRILMGINLAGVTVFLPMYISEISEDSIRGKLGCIRGVAADIGILFAYCIGPYLSIRLMAIVSISLPVVFLFLYILLPESPMFLLGKGMEEDAQKSYTILRGGDATFAEEEMKKLRAVVGTKHVSLMEILKVRGTRNALIIAVTIPVVIQLSGMNVVFSYASRIFEMSGSTISSDIAGIVVSIINLLGSIVAMVLAEIAGRRKILISTQFLQGIALGGLGIYMYAKSLGINVYVVGMLPLIFLSVYCFCVVAGVATIGYVVVSETFRPEARGIATSVMSGTIFSLAFISTKFHHSLEAVIGLHGCLWVYSAVSFAGTLFTIFRIPETRNRNLESILRQLNGDPPVEGKAVGSLSSIQK